MSIKKVRENNPRRFLEDLKSVSDVMVAPINSNIYLHVTKKGLLREAETKKIHYYLTDRVFKVTRDVMIII